MSETTSLREQIARLEDVAIAAQDLGRDHGEAWAHVSGKIEAYREVLALIDALPALREAADDSPTPRDLQTLEEAVVSDPVTHEIDPEVKALDDYLSGRMGRPQDTPTFGKFRRALRKLRARAEAAEAERDLLAAQTPSLIAERAHYKAEADALRARVPTEDEMKAFRWWTEGRVDHHLKVTGFDHCLRALVARNTPKETNGNG